MTHAWNPAPTSATVETTNTSRSGDYSQCSASRQATATHCARPTLDATTYLDEMRSELRAGDVRHAVGAAGGSRTPFACRSNRDRTRQRHHSTRSQQQIYTQCHAHDQRSTTRGNRRAARGHVTPALRGRHAACEGGRQGGRQGWWHHADTETQTYTTAQRNTLTARE